MTRWVITGGASGIGARLAAEVAEQNHPVTVWDIQRPVAALPNVDYQLVDLTDSASIARAAALVRDPVHAFVHSAGAGAPTSIADESVSTQMRRAFELHVVAFVESVHRLIPRLRAGPGSVVAVASAAMDLVYPGTLAYGTSKAALGRAVAQLAVELSPFGIRVNGIAPGAVAAPMSDALWATEELARARAATIPLGYRASPQQISRVVQFLASEDASYATGEIVHVDGGVRHGIFNQAARAFPWPKNDSPS